ncbi:MAG TPA: formylmethanofuran dehydrogenase subunit E family protein [Spirochaetota bacterium]|nr:tRNA CCA-pyrophosphorylase [Spirochaetota bacterium]HQO40984.1 formylmethanofuran dehydrogenase subunit E family protein [Spirochaetota bacterium]
MNIGKHTYEDYSQIVANFHGSAAPGLMIGGFMVDLALKNLPEGEFFDAICETPSCLPDAIQLLTPCTTGNGWMTVLDFGKFAIAMYDKSSGNGIRIFLDKDKLKNWPEVNSWFLKLKPKKEQNYNLLMSQIKDAGCSILSMQKIRVNPETVSRGKSGPSTICPLCGEYYPVKHGEKCRSCSGESPYIK